MSGTTDAAPATDEPFADWLLELRHGGNPETRNQIVDDLLPVRDRILDNAGLGDGDDALDVGCGDGLLGFAALERVAPSGTVTFSDPSEALLDECRSLAARSPMADRCRFVRTGLPELDGLAAESFDAVMTRSVVMYVDRKRESFARMHGVLRPDGCLSIYEPISRVLLFEPPDECYGYDVSGCVDAAAKLKAFYVGDSAEANPLVNYDERDLLRFAEEAGFTEITLDLNLKARVPTPNPVRDWETFLNMSPNPTAPRIREAFATLYDEDERRLVERCIRPQLDEGTLHMRYATAFLRAVRPA